MQDMLVKLYNVDDRRVLDAIAQLKAKGVTIRRAMPYEQESVVKWVRTNFSDGWASETGAAFTNHPISCFIAVENGRVVGFACHDATWRNAFGPTGVHEAMQGRGIGAGLLLVCMAAMKAAGYAYAIIAGVGPADFYRKIVGAELIPGSTPGFYPPFLREE
jgi:hypothetical protein